MESEFSAVNKIPDLMDIDIPLPEFPMVNQPARLLPESEPLKALFKGTPIEISIKSGTYLNGDNSLTPEMTLKISTKTANNIVSAHIYFSKRTEMLNKVGILVSKSKREELKGEGLGRALWEASLKLIQKFADKSNIPVVHQVKRSPSGMDEDKWDELFIELLRRHQYQETEGHSRKTWEKTYTPQTK